MEEMWASFGLSEAGAREYAVRALGAGGEDAGD